MKNKIILFLLVLPLLFIAHALAAQTATYFFDTTSANDTTILLGETLRSSSVLLQITTDQETTCKYSTFKGTSYNNMVETFDTNFETVHKKTLTDLTDGIYKYYIKCKNSAGQESAELEAKFSVSVPITAQIILSGGSPVKSGRIEVELITSKIVSQTPSLSYSFDGISYDPIPLFGSQNSWTGYLIVPDSDEEEVGSFKFQGKDLEGNIGTEITSGGIFLVDTQKPETVSDIKATGFEGRIELDWHYEEDEIEEFNIYRSTTPGVDFSDFYKSTNDKDEFSDTNVERGKTYYYRIAAVDEAENQGDLSKEVYATALLQKITSTSGLETRFLGIVDNLISDIETTNELADEAENNFNDKPEKEKTLYENLKLEREIDSASSELNSLKREVQNYKSQNLEKSELDRKINSGQLKLNTIRKKIPENIIIIEEKEKTNSVNEEELAKIILNQKPESSERQVNTILEKSQEIALENEFSTITNAYNLEIVYLDGSRKEISLIKEQISSTLQKNESILILELIPQEIAESVNDIEIKNTNYQILNEDSLIAFSADIKEIIYSQEKHINLDSINSIKTLVYYDFIQEQKSSAITGYLSFVDFQNSSNYFGVLLGILLVAALGGYLFFMKKNLQLSDRLIPLKQIITEAENKIIENDVDAAKEMYHAASLHYKNLDTKEKKKVWKSLEKLHYNLKNTTNNLGENHGQN